MIGTFGTGRLLRSAGVQEELRIEHSGTGQCRMLHKRWDHGAQNGISAIDGMWNSLFHIILVKQYVKIVPWENCPAASPSTLLLDGRTLAASRNLFGLPTALLAYRPPCCRLSNIASRYCLLGASDGRNGTSRRWA